MCCPNSLPEPVTTYTSSSISPTEDLIMLEDPVDIEDPNPAYTDDLEGIEISGDTGTLNGWTTSDTEIFIYGDHINE